jgi:ribosomal protection tetracycline resistance protein
VRGSCSGNSVAAADCGAAVTSIALGDLTVNLVDTPGHPDFIAEVERSLAVLDAAVLVVSTVEGVQPQTVAIWRALRRIGVPTAVFLNKVDRRDADVDRVVTQLHGRLAAHPVMLTSVTGQGGRDARVRLARENNSCGYRRLIWNQPHLLHARA